MHVEICMKEALIFSLSYDNILHSDCISSESENGDLPLEIVSAVTEQSVQANNKQTNIYSLSQEN